jgi:gamma-glutamyl hercynylcysteine S-oxide synthase
MQMKPLTRFILIAAVFLLAGIVVTSQDLPHAPTGTQIPGPGLNTSLPAWVGEMRGWSRDANADYAQWLRDLKKWRHERLIRIGFDDSFYRRPELAWSQRDFIQPQMMVEERTFYDVESGKYTVDRYLADVTKRYGGIDSVLIWPVYPNIGIDNRNQWDLARDMPGGIPALRKMVNDFHAHGVRVLFPAMPWDNGTHDPGVPYWEATAALLAETGADGINGDTFAGVPRAYATAADKLKHPIMIEPELAPASEEQLIWNVQSWAYWKYEFTPTVSTLKWLESRHLPIVCDRWSKNKTDDLQYAFFNGAGYSSWENIWGIWNQLTERDAEALRRIAYLERQFAPLLASEEWEPHTPTLRYGVFASKFSRDGASIWTIVNRNEYDVNGKQMIVPTSAGLRFFDLWHGTELKPVVEGGNAVLTFSLEPHGFGAIYATGTPESTRNLKEVLAKAQGEFGRALGSYSSEWHVLPQKVTPAGHTAARSSAPEGMVRIPSGDFDFSVSGIEIEGGNGDGVDVQYPWEDSPRRQHLHRLHVPAFDIDRYPVTNAQFKTFLDASHYRPQDGHNFLRDWKNDRPPSGWEQRPVTWISLEDARAYAAWAGKRLPREWEWQYAAQGNDGRSYPWGNEWSADAVPVPEQGRDLSAPAIVGTHAKGASPFGVEDLVGTVWQWTDEYTDDHTRAAILRGGSYYQPQSSIWYFPQAYKLNQHGKYLLMAPSKDRSGTVGFRCVADAE